MLSTFTITKSTAIKKIWITFILFHTRSFRLTLIHLARATMTGLIHTTTLVTRRRNCTQPATTQQRGTFGTLTPTHHIEWLILFTATVLEPRHAQKGSSGTAATWRRRTNKERANAPAPSWTTSCAPERDSARVLKVPRNVLEIPNATRMLQSKASAWSRRRRRPGEESNEVPAIKI